MWLEILLFLILVVLYFVMKDRKPANMPPGPFEIPFFGSMPLFDGEKAEELRKEYGDIVTHRTGTMRSVLLFDYNLGREVLGRPDMSGRPSFFSSFSLDEKGTGGLLGSNGAQWQHDRRFSLRNLRNLGMGKSRMEGAINIEAQALVEDLKLYKGEPIKFPDSFRTAALNIIWQMVISRRYDLRSKEVEGIYKATNDFRDQPIYTLIPMFFPSLEKYLPKFIMDAVFQDYKIKSFIEEIRHLCEKSLDEHENDLENPRDLVDEYLKEMKDREEEGNNEFCRRGALLQIINDLFGAGSDTINTMLKWNSYLLAKFPDIAKKIQNEIDEVVPSGVMVSLDDKPNLPYVEAFINEALRYSSMIIMNVQHTALQDTTIGNYFIPKDTIITVVNYSCHHDPKYWENPHKFMPERFLDDDGSFKAPKAGLFAFGQGRRQCLGELLARMELFLFTAAIAQNFDITFPPGVVYDDKYDNQLGLRVPFDKGLVYKERKTTAK